MIDLIITSATFGSSVISCDTLTHEAVRSDHIAVLVDLDFDTKDKSGLTKSYRPLKGSKWYVWRERTEADFETWTKRTFSNFKEAYEDFNKTLTKAFEDTIPLKTTKDRDRKQQPCWWDGQVNTAKKSLNHFQRKFRKRNTIQNKASLIQAEDNFCKAKEEAQERWAAGLIDKFEAA